MKDLFLSFVVVGVRQHSTLLCVGERGRGQYSDVRVCWVERKHGKEEKKRKTKSQRKRREGPPTISSQVSPLNYDCFLSLSSTLVDECLLVMCGY